MIQRYKTIFSMEQERILFVDRNEILLKLNPTKLRYGSSDHQRYFGALIREDLVPSQNIRYGNALSILCHEDWEQLCVRSRLRVMLYGRSGNNVERVPS